MDEETDLIDGTASIADVANDYGGNYVANQNAYDVADNGAVTTNNGVTTVSSPSWFNSLTSLLNGGVAVATAYGSVSNAVTGKGSAASAAQKTAAATSASPGATSNSSLMWIGAAVLAVLGLVFFFRK